MSLKYKSIAAFVLLCLIWSSTWMAIKIGLQTLPPFLSAGLRFFVAFLTLYLFMLLRRMRIPGGWSHHRFYLLFGFMNFTASYGMVYFGQQYIPSGLSSVLFSAMPFFVVGLSLFFLKEEKISFLKVSGVSIGFIGLLVIFLDQWHLSHPRAWLGMVLVTLSPLFSAAGTILAKKARQKFDPVTMSTVPLLYAAIMFLTIAHFTEQKAVIEFNHAAVLSILYLGIFGTAIAFAVYFWMLKTTPAILMSLITFITPPLALLWGWAVLAEPITWRLIAGMVIIFSGILLVRKSE
jgi:drug/metabolite transporter (DMT)-like permease